jgi:hypothetical protein
MPRRPCWRAGTMVGGRRCGRSRRSSRCGGSLDAGRGEPLLLPGGAPSSPWRGYAVALAVLGKPAVVPALNRSGGAPAGLVGPEGPHAALTFRGSRPGRAPEGGGPQAAEATRCLPAPRPEVSFPGRVRGGAAMARATAWAARWGARSCWGLAAPAPAGRTVRGDAGRGRRIGSAGRRGGRPMTRRRSRPTRSAGADAPSCSPPRRGGPSTAQATAAPGRSSARAWSRAAYLWVARRQGRAGRERRPVRPEVGHDALPNGVVSRRGSPLGGSLSGQAQTAPTRVPLEVISVSGGPGGTAFVGYQGLLDGWGCEDEWDARTASPPTRASTRAGTPTASPSPAAASRSALRHLQPAQLRAQGAARPREDLHGLPHPLRQADQRRSGSEATTASPGATPPAR